MWFRWPRYDTAYILCFFVQKEKTLTVFLHLQLVCEEVNVDRFYPVLYPKVGAALVMVYYYCDSLSLTPPALNLHHISENLTRNILSCRPQASRLIVTFDEHVISNNFKFGVIYQKFGQVGELQR